jgi:hypothetical protein
MEQACAALPHQVAQADLQANYLTQSGSSYQLAEVQAQAGALAKDSQANRIVTGKGQSLELWVNYWPQTGQGLALEPWVNHLQC